MSLRPCCQLAFPSKRFPSFCLRSRLEGDCGVTRRLNAYVYVVCCSLCKLAEVLCYFGSSTIFGASLCARIIELADLSVPNVG